MKLFLSPLKTATFFAPLVVLLYLIPRGRNYAGDGAAWTLFGGVCVLVLFAFAALHWPGLNQLGASFSAWMNSATLTALSVAVALGVLTAASSILNQHNNPYYQAYDVFLFTNGQDVPWTDTNGDPYVMVSAGQDATSMTMTVLLHIAFFFVAAFAGVALGLAYTTFGAGRALAGGFVTFALTVALYWAVESNVGNSYTAAAPGLLTACLVTLGVSAAVISRTKRFVP